jgi:hypothetical protein
MLNGGVLVEIVDSMEVAHVKKHKIWTILSMTINYFSKDFLWQSQKK